MSKLTPELADQLARWTAAGIIDEAQAARIESAEQAGSEPAATPRSAGCAASCFCCLPSRPAASPRSWQVTC